MTRVIINKYGEIPQEKHCHATTASPKAHT